VKCEACNPGTGGRGEDDTGLKAEARKTIEPIEQAEARDAAEREYRQTLEQIRWFLEQRPERGPAGYFRANQPRVVLSVLKNRTSSWPTLRWPAGDWCVPSAAKSDCS
jgi:hypothetical protein